LGRLTFAGGVHPPENKKLTSSEATRDLPIPDILYVPLQQHLGAPPKPIVAKGDEVKCGQPIAEPGGFVSVPVHSPVSGKVKDIAPWPHPLGKTMATLIIENDGQMTWASDLKPIENWRDVSPDVLKKRILDGGVVGMGGATFPTHVKLSPPDNKPIDVLIINGAECEPFLTSDHRLMLEKPEGIVAGLEIFAKILGVKRAFIAIESNKPDAVKTMREAAKDIDYVRVVSLHVKYPQGAEKQLIYALTGRQVPSGGLPMDVGALVQNVGTAYAVTQAVKEGRPLIGRIVTLSGLGVSHTGNYKVAVGTQVAHLIEHAGGYSGEPGKIIFGGPMMGISQSTDQVPIIRGTSGVLVIPANQVGDFKPGPCIRCGRCVDVCPMGLLPCDIAIATEYEDIDEARRLGATDCIECGSCSYICPTKRMLVHRLRSAKASIARQSK
jgi:electron transport complex protein RnfC